MISPTLSKQILLFKTTAYLSVRGLCQGLTKQRMLECNALIFYQLIVTIVDPAMSGIDGDTRMGYYKDVARNTNMYAFGVKNKGGTRGHVFFPPVLRSYLSGMALCVATSTQILLNHG
jgi:hypothetical protein